jgi:cytochrome c peroxidase
MKPLSRGVLGASIAAVIGWTVWAADPGAHSTATDPFAQSPLEWQVPDEKLVEPFAEQQPITFVNRAQNLKDWEALPKFWNETTEKVLDPTTNRMIERKAVKLKVPLGLARNPAIPASNPLTVSKWKLGKELYFETALSANNSMSCATCHDPGKGYTDQAKFSAGILGKLGGMSAPTVINSAFHAHQFWDGRAASLEDQAQGPVQNALEMFDGQGDAWVKAVQRLRAMPEYVKQFQKVFGTLPTRDAVAKAIAAYERTVVAANSIYDRAEVAMRTRVEEEEGNKFELTAKDFATALKAAFAAKDTHALKALQLDVAKDADKVPAIAERINAGRVLYFGKARCSNCHIGDNFTDNEFHNLGVGAVNGKLTVGALGRFASLPTGAKDPIALGAFKTPTVRGLLDTAPYMHDGSEATLEAVIDFYDRGGNVNPHLDVRMRDFDAEQAAAKLGKPAVIPLKLKLSASEKADLVLFLRALQGDPVDATVADAKWLPK